MICILRFCPFETWFMRNRCCCTYRLHPEHFSTQTNESLSCAMCQEKLCQHKTQLKKLWKKYGRLGG